MLKVGDKIRFIFAGMPEEGIIIKKEGEIITVDDGKYKYPIRKEVIIKNK